MKNLIIFVLAFLASLACGQSMKVHTASGVTQYTLAYIDSITFEIADSSIHFTWALGTAMPSAISNMAHAYYNGKIYSFGGQYPSYLTTCLSYDISGGTWSSISNSGFSPRYSSGAAVLDGEIYVIAGYSGFSGVSTVQCYNPLLDSWSDKAALSNNCGEGKEVAVVNGKIYAVGGHENNGVVSNVLEEYNKTNNSWTQKSPCPIALRYAATVGFNNKMYLFGGSTYEPGPSYKAFCHTLMYDPIGDVWTYGSPIPDSTKISASGLAVIGTNAYLLGGYVWDGTNNTPSNKIYIYNFASDSWQTSNDTLPIPMGYLQVEAVNNKVYIFGITAPDYTNLLYIGSY